MPRKSALFQSYKALLDHEITRHPQVRSSATKTQLTLFQPNPIFTNITFLLCWHASITLACHHCGSAVAALPLRLCRCGFAVAALPLRLCHGGSAMVALPWWFCHGGSAMVQFSLCLLLVITAGVSCVSFMQQVHGFLVCLKTILLVCKIFFLICGAP